MKVMILAGGTGGHVMPALAVARHLRQQGHQVHWLGTRAGIEARLVPQEDLPISFIDIQGIRGKKIITLLQAPFRICKAIVQSYRVLASVKPDAVLCMGGYVSGPGAIAAWLRRCPIVLHEQNAIAGWTNRVLANFAKRIMVAFPNAFKKHLDKIIETGNPVRQDILNILPPKERLKLRQTPVRVLVLGGSQGATKLNEVLPQAFALLPQDQCPQIWHQTGKNNLATTQKAYTDCQVIAQVSDFIQDMQEAYAWADIVICRAGALTIAEISAVGLPSILIPFPFAVDDHQTHNAKYLSDHGAAFLLAQSELTPNKLHELLLDLIINPDKRLGMAMASHALAKPLATTIVAEQCLEVSCEP
ncbi:undecaprenyldiphospho-muramoylpentapeptide beta-N-acetylglucosaminyltransferase [Candidatus Berkiella aquae]|nr:undecaprenyldiphospho-muramoylpentapeptide beta-N-acetylglucosaminyltransferase [Candidatus Berkiella aquae]MCS5710807.1 undecaprenyldiphospho-muramoylpentapeptide beta-N-acetylglucosaminyltransferase [Candidatus Berkiella aquae]